MTTLVARGDLADIHLTDRNGQPVITKTARAVGNHDLLAIEADTVTRLTRDNKMDPDNGMIPSLKGIERMKHAAFVPRLVHAEPGLNVFEPLNGMHPLSQILYDLGPLDPKDVAWMWRRVLVAVGFAHRQGRAHCAPHPEHIMIHPEKHGVTLIDWCYSTKPGATALAYVGRYKHTATAPEIVRKAPTSPATDIYTATCAMMAAIDHDLCPPQLRGFAQACTAREPNRRPQNAWRLKDDFDTLIERLWGPKTFRQFDYTPTT